MTTVSVVVEAWCSSIVVLGSNGVRSDSPMPSNGVRPDIAIALINEQTESTMNQETCVLPTVNDNSEHVSVMGIENWRLDLILLYMHN